MSMNQVASDLYKALSESDDRKVKPYDTKAEVLRTEDNTVWVKIPGGVDETPVQKTNNANAGDQVMVRISGGRAWLLGNETSPATDDTQANAATQLAEGAGNLAKTAADSASEAQQNAQAAYNYADQAKKDAHDANESAKNASIAASSALLNLSEVENVVGTLTWISEHGTYTVTTDTEVSPNTVYYIYNSEDMSYTAVIPEGDENPSEEGWYVLTIDQSVQNYIASHISQNDYGLNLMADSSTYRLHIGSLTADGDMGVYILNGGQIMGFYGANTTIGTNDGAHITLGTVDGQAHLGLWQGPVEVAWITDQELHINKTVVLQAMTLGKWSWTTYGDHLGLYWVG